MQCQIDDLCNVYEVGVRLLIPKVISYNKT